MYYQIGDFSRISRLSVKTLRYYHEYGLLEPTHINEESGYRYYDERCLERVRIINELKDMDFPLKEIKDILGKCTDDAQLLAHALRKAEELKEKISHYKQAEQKLKAFLRQADHAKTIKEKNINTNVMVKDLPDIIVASIRFKGKYQDVTGAFKRLFRYYGRHVAGAPVSLYYDHDFKENDADIEACIPIRASVTATDGTEVKGLKGCKAITFIHRGLYETIGSSYKVLIDHINGQGSKISIPSREVYLKGPGMILPRSPNKFITEIQMPLCLYSRHNNSSSFK